MASENTCANQTKGQEAAVQASVLSEAAEILLELSKPLMENKWNSLLPDVIIRSNTFSVVTTPQMESHPQIYLSSSCNATGSVNWHAGFPAEMFTDTSRSLTLEDILRHYYCFSQPSLWFGTFEGNVHSLVNSTQLRHGDSKEEGGAERHEMVKMDPDVPYHKEIFKSSVDPTFKKCKLDKCNRSICSQNLCSKHGASRRCSFDGCEKTAQGRTAFCITHGGGRRCTFPGCGKGARDKLFCAAHGGGRRCSRENCNKLAVPCGKFSNCCVRHGGGRRCATDGCDKSAQSGTSHCVRCGGGRRCVFPDCAKVARGKTDYCMSHTKLFC